MLGSNDRLRMPINSPEYVEFLCLIRLTPMSMSTSFDSEKALPLVLAAYQTALAELGGCNVDTCLTLGPGQQQNLTCVAEQLRSLQFRGTNETQRAVCRINMNSTLQI